MSGDDEVADESTSMSRADQDQLSADAGGAESSSSTSTRRRLLQVSAAGVGAAALAGGGAWVGSAQPWSNPSLPSGILDRIRRGERFRLRDLGIQIGDLAPGRWNAITDVPGVEVGYKTIIRDSPRITRTGVTIIKPRAEPMQRNWCHAGYYSLNGNGEMTGTHWLDETGKLTSVIGITNTMQVGVVRDALVKIGLETEPDLEFLLPVVAETYDGGLNDPLAFGVTEQDVRDAYASAASGPVAEGNVGGGTGMHYFDFKGGSGTSSRIVDYKGTKYTVGVFVQANYGQRPYLRVNGAPVGKDIPFDEVPKDGPALRSGSCIAVIATDAPLLPTQCKRLAVRAGIGIANTGSVGDNGSGDIYLAFSTANDVRQDKEVDYDVSKSIPDNDDLNLFFHAVSEAFQEAAHNAACMARTMTGVDKTIYEIPLDRLVQVVQDHRLYGGGFSG